MKFYEYGGNFSPSHVFPKSIFVLAFLATVSANFRLGIFQVSNPVMDGGV